jgi:hypothetical protein
MPTSWQKRYSPSILRSSSLGKQSPKELPQIVTLLFQADI